MMVRSFTRMVRDSRRAILTSSSHTKVTAAGGGDAEAGAFGETVVEAPDTGEDPPGFDTPRDARNWSILDDSASAETGSGDGLEGARGRSGARLVAGGTAAV
jgi:hypothetical protein